MMDKSAQPLKMKISTLSQETQRRMTNTGRDVDWDERVEILVDLKDKMLRFGYSKDTIENIIKSGLEGYYRKVRNEEKGVGRVNRKQSEDIEIREQNKLTAKTNWQLKTKSNDSSKQTSNLGPWEHGGTP